MPSFSFTQPIAQLEARKGGYYFLRIEAGIVEQFERKRATRLICTLNNELSYSCGLNHLGDGHFFIILATKHLKKLGLELGDPIQFEIHEDPNPLGVEVPEVLEVLLAQDEGAKAVYEALTDGKKRNLIHTMNRVKNIDLKVEKALKILEAERLKLAKKKL